MKNYEVQEARERKLKTIALVIEGWLNYDTEMRDEEGLPVNDDCHLRSPPVWPTRGMLREWIKALHNPQGR